MMRAPLSSAPGIASKAEQAVSAIAELISAVGFIARLLGEARRDCLALGDRRAAIDDDGLTARSVRTRARDMKKGLRPSRETKTQRPGGNATMTITNSDNQRHADPQRPAGIADDEWAAVLRVRQRKAEEAAAAEHCTHVMADLNGAADGGFEDEDWDPVARRFLDRRPTGATARPANSPSPSCAPRASRIGKSRTTAGHAFGRRRPQPLP